MNPSPNLEETGTTPSSNVWRKKRRSVLDPFANELVQMDENKTTLPEIVAWLDQRGVSTSGNNVSKFLINRREEAELQEQQERLASRSNKCVAFEEWLAKHPTPDLGAVIKMFKLLMMEMAANKTVEPEVLKLADRLTRTALRFVNDQSREAYRTRKLVMEEAKHAEWVKCERARGFEFCLAESKKYPAVADMYRAAFDALEKCRRENGDI
jgi:hypothetical protein